MVQAHKRLFLLFHVKISVKHLSKNKHIALHCCSTDDADFACPKSEYLLGTLGLCPSALGFIAKHNSPTGGFRLAGEPGVDLRQIYPILWQYVV